MGGTNIYLTDDDRAELDALAVRLSRQDGKPVSRSEAIRRAISYMVKRLDYRAESDARRARARKRG